MAADQESRIERMRARQGLGPGSEGGGGDGGGDDGILLLSLSSTHVGHMYTRHGLSASPLPTLPRSAVPPGWLTSSADRPPGAAAGGGEGEDPGTGPCRDWANGRCARGANCMFRHGGGGAAAGAGKGWQERASAGRSWHELAGAGRDSKS